MTVIPSETNKSRRTTQRLTKWLGACVLFSFFGLVAASTNAHANTVTYNFDNIFLDDGMPMTGKFDWTYDTGDFEGGSGQFTELVVPYWNSADYAFLTVIFDIKNSIEFNRDSLPSTHDEGYGINLKFSPALTPTGSAMVDTVLSKFECCGNGFKAQGFRSAVSISLIAPSVPVPPAILLLGSG